MSPVDRVPRLSDELVVHIDARRLRVLADLRHLVVRQGVLVFLREEEGGKE